jgi:hypothetical protein
MKQPKTGLADPVLKPTLHDEADYDDPPDDSDMNLSDISPDFGKSDKTIARPT